MRKYQAENIRILTLFIITMDKFNMIDRIKHGYIHLKCLGLCLIGFKNPTFYIKGFFRTFFTRNY